MLEDCTSIPYHSVYLTLVVVEFSCSLFRHKFPNFNEIHSRRYFDFRAVWL
jgi:hypothetical protein